MLTLNTILKELKNIPADRLKDLYSIINSLKANKKKPASNRKKILSFAGCFSDMTEEDYSDFIHEVQKTRNNLFDRDINL